jgi:hypothetical protein
LNDPADIVGFRSEGATRIIAGEGCPGKEANPNFGINKCAKTEESEFLYLIGWLNGGWVTVLK